MTRAERGAGARLAQAVQQPTASAFEFGIETRVQCSESGRVSYKRDAPTNVLALNIPMEAAANKSEVEEYQVTRPCSPGLSQSSRLSVTLRCLLQAQR